MLRISPTLLLLALAALPGGAAPSRVPAGDTTAQTPPTSVMPIAAVLADRDKDSVPDAKGQWVRVRGTVTIPPDVLRTRNFQAIIQDDSGGLTLFNRDLRMALAPGDRVEATGKVQQYKGAVQLADAEVRRIGGGALPAAQSISIAQADGWTYMGRRVQVEGVVGALSLDSFGILRVTDDNGTSVSLFIPASATERFDWKLYPRGARVSATGVASIYKATWPYDGGFQVIVTLPADLRVLAPPAPIWKAWLLWGALMLVGLLAISLAVFHFLQNRQKARERELATLIALSSAVAAPDIGEEQLARHACEILTTYGIVEAAMVQIFDKRGCLRQLAASTADPKLGSTLDLGEPLPAGESSGESHQRQIEARLVQYGLTLLAIHPLLAPSGSQGFLIALSPRKRRPSEMQERTLLAAVKLLAMALENSRAQQRAGIERQEMQQLVITDELTKLYNRRFLDAYLRVQIPLAQRRGGGLAFLAIDIDNFKCVNDAWGHEVGDRVLQGVAGVIRDTIRSSDLPVRMGGEEFLAVIVETDIPGAQIFADRLRATIESTLFDDVVEGQVLRVTVSIGVALYGLHGFTAAALLRASDDAMYVSKHSGRNRVMFAAMVDVPVGKSSPMAGVEAGVRDDV